MQKTTQKREAGLLDGTPEKRMYWSIISDYDLKTGICELIDNAIDMWVAGGRTKELRIDLMLDLQRQMIRISDSAGGVKESDLRLLIAPGASSNNPNAESIGVFGVGSKRAVVALAETVSIKTRFSRQRSFQIDVTTGWLESEDWHIPHFEIPDIPAGVTTIELSALRKPISQEDAEALAVHFSETYASYLLDEKFQIFVNEKSVAPKLFDQWAYPTGFEPKKVVLSVDLPGHARVKVEITAGLILDRDPVRENYGVYIYCNDRLIAKEVRSRDVGYFVTSEAGVPHPDASLCRAIVNIHGSAQMMPWNSSKSDINFKHSVFFAIRPSIIQLVSHFSSLSRRFKNDWEGKVFSYESGDILETDPSEIQPGNRLVLPPLPRVNKKYIETLKATNKVRIKDEPWTLGLVEAMAAVDVITRQNLETKNRIALILLDSNFEIALKEFVVHRPDLFPPRQVSIQTLFEKRHLVIAEVTKHVVIDGKLLKKAKHYYELRNKLIHERATVNIGDSDIQNYRKTIERVLNILFKLKF